MDMALVLIGTVLALYVVLVVVLALAVFRNGGGDDVLEVPDRSARVDFSTEGRRSGSGMPTLPANVARLDDRPRASFRTPAAKGFNKDRTVGVDQITPAERARWTHDRKWMN
jgi:hypothetical protein